MEGVTPRPFRACGWQGKECLVLVFLPAGSVPFNMCGGVARGQAGARVRATTGVNSMKDPKAAQLRVCQECFHCN